MPEISSAIVFSSIIWKITLFFSWPIIIFLGYKSRRWWAGLIMAYIIWFPTIWYTYSGQQYVDLSLAFGIKIFFATVAAILGAIFGYIGGGKNKT